MGKNQSKEKKDQGVAEIQQGFKDLELEAERKPSMPALSRVNREKFVELKALKELYEDGIIDNTQYENCRDGILEYTANQTDPLSLSSSSGVPKGMKLHSSTSALAPYFDYGSTNYLSLLAKYKNSPDLEATKAWWDDSVKAQPATTQCFIFLCRLAASLQLPWRTVVTCMVLLHRYAHVLALWAQDTAVKQGLDGNNYIENLSHTNRVVVCAASLLLASKVEETLFNVRTLLLNIKAALGPHFNGLLLSISSPGDSGKRVADRLSNSIKDHEIDMLIRLGMDITFDHPYHYLPLLSRIIEQRSKTEIDTKTITDHGYAILDACLASPIWIFYRPQLIAVAALSLAWEIFMSSKPATQKVAFKWSVFQLTNANKLELISLLKDFSLALKEAPSFKHVVTPKPPQIDIPKGKARVQFTKKYKPGACRAVSDYKMKKKIDEGTYGAVSVAKDTATNELVAVKQLKNTKGRSGFPYYMLREVLFLQRLNNENVVRGRDIVVERNEADISSSVFYIAMEYVSYDMRAVWFEQRDKNIVPLWTEAHVKHLMLQLLNGIAYMHQLGIMHRDIKLKNLLLDDNGILKVADLGSIRETGRTQLKFTTAVVTLWYRPPELLLGATEYTCAIDMWSIGCVFVELLCLKPLFPGYSMQEMISWITSVLGEPPDAVWEKCFAHLPHAKTVETVDEAEGAEPLSVMLSKISESGKDLIKQMLAYDPSERITAFDALKHPYFSEDPKPEVFRIEQWNIKSDGEDE